MGLGPATNEERRRGGGGKATGDGREGSDSGDEEALRRGRAGGKVHRQHRHRIPKRDDKEVVAAETIRKPKHLSLLVVSLFQFVSLFNI